MPVTPEISAVSPDRVASDGGYRLVVTGTFTVGRPMRVYLGETGTSADALCYSGKIGQGSIVYAQSATTLWCYTPRLPVGRLLRVTVIEVTEAANQSEAVDVTLRVRQPDYKTSVFSLRHPWPKEFLVGPKNLEQLPAVPEWE